MPKLDTVSPVGSPRDLTAVAQDYLKVIWTAQEWSLEKVSTKLLAERLGNGEHADRNAVSRHNRDCHARVEAGIVRDDRMGAKSVVPPDLRRLN